MEPARRSSNAELTRLRAEHARLTTALQTVAGTYGSTWEDAMVVSRQFSSLEDAIRAVVVRQARWEAGR
jgi:hypothetical protein